MGLVGVGSPLPSTPPLGREKQHMSQSDNGGAFAIVVAIVVVIAPKNTTVPPAKHQASGRWYSTRLDENWNHGKKTFETKHQTNHTTPIHNTPFRCRAALPHKGIYKRAM